MKVWILRKSTLCCSCGPQRPCCAAELRAAARRAFHNRAHGKVILVHAIVLHGAVLVRIHAERHGGLIGAHQLEDIVDADEVIFGENVILPLEILEVLQRCNALGRIQMRRPLAVVALRHELRAVRPCEVQKKTAADAVAGRHDKAGLSGLLLDGHGGFDPLVVGCRVERDAVLIHEAGLGKEIDVIPHFHDVGNVRDAVDLAVLTDNVNHLLGQGVGISGTVQHTCAIEGAQFVVSVNPDRSARIFDYGIVSRFA